TGSLPDSSEHTTFAKVYATDTTLITTTPTRKIIVIKLAPPTSLTTQMLESGSVLLQWIDKSKNETGFSIEKSNDEINFSQVAIAPANAQSIVLNGYLKTMRYLFRVRAIRGNIIGSASQVVPAVYRTGIVIKSNPAGAQVSCNNRLLGITPLTIDTITSSMALLFNMRSPMDSTVFRYTYYPQFGMIDTISHVFAAPNWVTIFTSDTVWEFNAPGKNGVFLKLGKVFSASSTKKDSVDLFYRSNTFDLTSAAELAALSRTTKFKVATESNLFDGADSPAQDATWVKSFLYSVTNYVYVFDADSHYSKLVISQKGGGTTGKPAWVILKWMYNTRVNDLNF
ncbi:MAG: PEGA domain-containing protein, partial [Ignavibacteriales bacterium]|nr:PEGA domain-containing protein [Ignavibacteriales bacterium]